MNRPPHLALGKVTAGALTESLANLYVPSPPFAPMSSPPQVSLPKFALFVTACAVGGFGLGALIAAVLGEKFWHGIMG